MDNFKGFKSRTQYEAHLVAGMRVKGHPTQYELIKYCSDYFWDNYSTIFFAGQEEAKDILQNTHLKLWENIEDDKIYAEHGILMGRDNKPLQGSLRTYFMSIARLKYLEYVRTYHPNRDMSIDIYMQQATGDACISDYKYLLYGDDENTQRDIIADLISRMSARCGQILTKYYYEGKTFDIILAEIDSISSKDVLKAKKAKCMQSLRQKAIDIYRRYVNTQ